MLRTVGESCRSERGKVLIIEAVVGTTETGRHVLVVLLRGELQ